MQRKAIDPRLDSLYNRTVKCPYCRGKILKYTTECHRCGVTKEQIAGASNRRAKEIIKSRTGEKIFKTKTRPSDISFTKMVLFLIIGIFGTYNFYSGRRIRGFIMLVFVIVGLVCNIIFPIQFDEAGIMLSNPTRELFSSRMLPFPGDLTLALAFLIWAVDIFAVVLGFYKYPARLGEKIEVKR